MYLQIYSVNEARVNLEVGLTTCQLVALLIAVFDAFYLEVPGSLTQLIRSKC